MIKCLINIDGHNITTSFEASDDVKNHEIHSFIYCLEKQKQEFMNDYDVGTQIELENDEK